MPSLEETASTGSSAKREHSSSEPLSPVGHLAKKPNNDYTTVNKKIDTSTEDTTNSDSKGKKKKRRKYKPNKNIDETSPLGILQLEIQEILKEFQLIDDQIANDVNAILNDEVDHNVYHRNVSNVKVLKLTSNGDGIALVPHPVKDDGKQIVIIPFALPGDVVDIKIFKTHPNFVESDLLKVVINNSGRSEDLIRCKYFGKCSGCQYQGLTYETQLEFKRRTVENAYKFFAKRLIANNKIPKIGETVASPKQYEYRTKLTPHFDVPRKRQLTEKPPMGFGTKGKPKWRDTDGGDSSILDIEECVIGTRMINLGMKNERAAFDNKWGTYKKSATILLREHTRIANTHEKAESKEFQNEQEGSRDDKGEVTCIIEPGCSEDEILVKSCVTQSRQIVTEYINGFEFEFSAGEFFQNNNSILPIVTEYVCSNLQIPLKNEADPLYLVDAYCGSGLFSITASHGVDKVVGVDVSADSVSFARKNAERNGVKNAKFIDGKAEKIFAEIDTPSDLTSVIIDPSRKGCDDVFLNQLSDYMPARVVYVSCNVHSQARDVEFFLNETTNGGNYKIESIRGFDFFPQTHHVESVAVLSRY